MTVLTKPSEIVKKSADTLKSPLVDVNVCDEDKVEIEPLERGSVRADRKKRSGALALACMTLAAALVSLTGVACGLVLYRQYLKMSTMPRYRGYCAVPMDYQGSPEALNAKPQFWSGGQPNLFAYAKDPDSLNEEVDIDANTETISVFNNGRQVEILHDFTNNYTGIIDTPRCFLLDLDPGSVLRPDVFVLSIERGADFDTSRVQVSLRAVLPALPELVERMRALRARCLGRPTYRLQPVDDSDDDDDAPIRKRSVDAFQPEYVEFSGKHVKEIDIANLADLFEYEKTHTA